VNVAALILMLVLVFVGCAPTRWTKAGLTEDEFFGKYYECERDARQSGYFGTGLAAAINFSPFSRDVWRQRATAKLARTRWCIKSRRHFSLRPRNRREM
jgi:hypothetical protein